MTNPTFRARIGNRTFDLVLDDDQLLVDGEPVPYSFEQVADGYYTLLLEGTSYSLVLESGPGEGVRVHLAGRQLEVQVKDERALLLERFGLKEAGKAAQRTVHAPMPGLVLRVLVEPGQTVQEGDGLLVLEAMKMENELRAPADGAIAAVHVAPGDAVGKNELLVEFEA